MNENAIRLDILKFYYNLYKKDSTDYERYDELIKKYDITENELIGHVRYLFDKQLLNCICTYAAHEYGKPIQCKITAHGIDVIEHLEQDAPDIPLKKTFGTRLRDTAYDNPWPVIAIMVSVVLGLLLKYS